MFEVEFMQCEKNNLAEHAEHAEIAQIAETGNEDHQEQLSNLFSLRSPRLCEHTAVSVLRSCGPASFGRNLVSPKALYGPCSIRVASLSRWELTCSRARFA